jgi:hypothetical protein
MLSGERTVAQSANRRMGSRFGSFYRQNNKRQKSAFRISDLSGSVAGVPIRGAAMSAELVYPYRPSPIRLSLFVLLVGFGGVLFLKDGAASRHDETILNVIRLGPRKVAAFHYILAAFLFGMVAREIYRFLVAYAKKIKITLGPSSVRIPVGLAWHETAVAYVDIQSVLHQKLRSGECLTITQQDGKQVVIAAKMLPSKDTFVQIRAELAARAKTAQSL